MGESKNQEASGQPVIAPVMVPGLGMKGPKGGSDSQSCCVKAAPSDFTGFLIIYLPNGTNNGNLLDQLFSSTITQYIHDPQTCHFIFSCL